MAQRLELDRTYAMVGPDRKGAAVMDIVQEDPNRLAAELGVECVRKVERRLRLTHLRKRVTAAVMRQVAARMLSRAQELEAQDKEP